MAGSLPSAPPTTDDEAIAHARECLAAAGSIAVLTGAGISTESGIPTIRDAMTGLWSRFTPTHRGAAMTYPHGGER
jgi:NAD-dependent deacetylase